jgi:hypothetical protein
MTLLVALLALAACTPEPPASHAPSVRRPAPAHGRARETAPPDARWLGAEVRFASEGEARAVLGRSDAFTQAQGDLDRRLRRGVGEALDEPAFVAYAGAQALGWDEAERRALAPALAEVEKMVGGLSLPLPPQIWLVKSTGAEEFGLPYTRGAAIVLPQAVVVAEKVTSGLLAHELLHVATRHDPSLRDRLYPLIGFERVGAVTYPPELLPSRVTNPDAFGLEHAIEVTVSAGGRRARVVPIIQCHEAPPDHAVGERDLMGLISLELVEIGVTGTQQVLAADATDYLKRASINTGYAIHPEEVLADNFALLLGRRGGKTATVARPDVLDALEAALSRPAP